MVDDDSVESVPGTRGEIMCLFAQAKIGEITCQNLDLTGILLAQILEWLLTSGHDDYVRGLLEEAVRDCETDAC